MKNGRTVATSIDVVPPYLEGHELVIPAQVEGVLSEAVVARDHHEGLHSKGAGLATMVLVDRLRETRGKRTNDTKIVQSSHPSPDRRDIRFHIRMTRKMGVTAKKTMQGI